MKTAKPVNETLLRRTVESVEQHGPLSNLSKLKNMVANVYNRVDKGEQWPDITPSIVGLRIDEWKIPVKTKPGKRGRQKGAGPVHRTERRDKFKSNPHFEEVKSALLADPYANENNALKILDGSMTAGIARACKQCCGGLTAEIRNCTQFGCGLWLFRPNQPEGRIAPPEEMITGANE